ncbi:DoxX family protein [Flavobacterium sp.]|uniref:DoxX family protein n=1 Tax=Flavobacterium sp. TaxID=239 RepID=UPI00286E8DBB|nr:DoxX family protein [Flavobacterium sp.]
MKKLLFSGIAINIDFGLLLIRLIIGSLMAFYGYEKLIHFNEMAASEFWMKQVSFLGMSSKISLGLTVFAEFICSLLLILGLFTRMSLFFLLFCMGWIFLVVFPMSILDKGDNGYQFNDAFIYFMIYLGLLFTGSGKYSLDAKLFSRS